MGATGIVVGTAAAINGGYALLEGLTNIGIGVIQDALDGDGGSTSESCSFSADTEVLMANGETKRIADVREGDMVLATDPETGETGAREVIATLPHTDQLLTLRLSSGDVITTEDHHYWNATDQAWQEGQHLDPGDRLLTADGDQVAVEGLDWSTMHTATAYDITIDDLHTFYVTMGDGSGESAVLVHNAGCDDWARRWVRRNGGQLGKCLPGGGNSLWDPGSYELATDLVEVWCYHTVAVRDGRVYDQFTPRGGVPIEEWKSKWSSEIDCNF